MSRERRPDDHVDAARLVADLRRSLGLSDVRLLTSDEPGADGRAAVRDALTVSEAPTVVVSAATSAAGDVEAWSELVAEAAGPPVWRGSGRLRADDLMVTAALVVVSNDPRVAGLLAAGAQSLRMDPGLGTERGRPGRVAVVSCEAPGPTPGGGIGSASSSLARSLAAAGHEVTFLYTGYAPHGDDERRVGDWARPYTECWVTFVALPERPAWYDCFHHNARRAYEVYTWLRERDEVAPWTVIHFPDCQGHGFYAVAARRRGVAFPHATVVLGTHGPTQWVHQANGMMFDVVEKAIDDVLERRSAELADVVVGPSAHLHAWATRQGWRLPARRFVQQYVVPQAARTPRGREGSAISELVFFGRLEYRKGLALFCDAVDQLATDETLGRTGVAFLGQSGTVGSETGRAYVERRAAGWRWPWTVHDDLGHDEAVAFLQVTGRLAVMPSLVDNSPNTVMEAIALGVPFVASSRGGTGEIIHPADLGRCTFDPVDPARTRVDAEDLTRESAGFSAEGLVRQLRRVLREGGAPARFAVAPAVTEQTTRDWHRRVVASGPGAVLHEAVLPPVSVVLSAGERGSWSDAVRGFREQSHRDLEVLAIGGEAGDRQVELPAGVHVIAAPAQGRGPALNAALAEARGSYLLVTTTDVVPERHLVSSLVGAAEGEQADVVTCVIAYDREGGTRHTHGSDAFIPLPAAPLAGLVAECFAGSCYLIRRTAVAAVGGWAEEGDPAGSEDHELLLRLVLAGRRLEIIPDPLARQLVDWDYPYGEEWGLASAMSVVDGQFRMLRPFHEQLPPGLRDLATLVRSQWWALRMSYFERLRAEERIAASDGSGRGPDPSSRGGVATRLGDTAFRAARRLQRGISSRPKAGR